MTKRIRPGYLAVFAVSAAYFTLLLPWDGFVDPDVFYHGRVSRLMWLHGPLHAFPWLDLTLLGSHYADLHFLFHVLGMPFVAAFGLANGMRILAVLLAAGCATAIFHAIRKLGLVRPEIWVGMLLLTQPFVTRNLYGKASPLAIGLFMLGLMAVWRRKPWVAFALGLVFALSHGGWLYLAGAAAILAFGRLVLDRDLEGLPLKKAVAGGLWREFVAVFLGGLAGMLVHPNFPQNLIFSWTQVFVIGLGTPFKHVVLGNEWYPADIQAVFTAYSPWIVAMLLGAVGLALAPRKPLDKDKAGLVLGTSILSAVLLALTLKSRRNTEYLAPVVAMWSAALWTLVDARRLYASFGETLGQYGKTGRKAITAVLLVLAMGLAAREVHGIWTSLHPVNYPDDVYRASMQAISSKAAPGDRVFHSSWDEFPKLFSLDDRLHYISGLDPTFLYVASSTLSDQVREVTWGVTTATREQAWTLIHDQTDSRFVFVSKKNHKEFLGLIESDPRYAKIADNPDSAAFEVKD